MPSAWEKRNAAARARGYRNYYDYRVHQYGKRPPSEPAETKGGRESGRQSAAALKRALKKPDRIALIVEVPIQTKHGTWSRMNYIATMTDGRIVEYSVPVRYTDDYPDLDAFLDYWHGLFDEADIDFVEYAANPATAATG